MNGYHNNLKYNLPTEKTKTAGGITKIPTNQSATARLITKRFVTVLNLRVVITERMTKVFPIIVMMINNENRVISTIFVHGQLSTSDRSCSVEFILQIMDFYERNVASLITSRQIFQNTLFLRFHSIEKYHMQIWVDFPLEHDDYDDDIWKSGTE